MGIERSIAGAAILIVSCVDQFQRHAPVDDAAVASDSAASPDAGRAFVPTCEVDHEVRTAYDGRGVELAPIARLDALGFFIERPGGVAPIQRRGGSFQLVASGVEPGRSWAVPFLQFHPHTGGSVIDPSLDWLSFARSDLLPGENSGLFNDTTHVVCSRHQGVGPTGEGRCALLSPGGPSLGFGVSLGESRHVVLNRNPASLNRYLTLSTHTAAAPEWTLRFWEMDLSKETDPVVTRRLPCSPTAALLAGRANHLWIATAGAAAPACDSLASSVQVTALGVRSEISAHDLFEPFTLDFSRPPLAAPGSGAAVIEPAVLEGDRSAGATLFINRRDPPPASRVRDAYFARLLPDAPWRLQRLVEGAEVRWATHGPTSGWLVGLSREGADGTRISELLRVDSEGRHLAPPTEYLRGLELRDLGYGIDFNEQGLWVVAAERLSPRDARFGIRIRRIELRAPPP